MILNRILRDFDHNVRYFGYNVRDFDDVLDSNTNIGHFVIFSSNFKEHLNEYLIMCEILTHIVDISTKIRPYNAREFDSNFDLIMFVILAQLFSTFRLKFETF